MRVALPLEQCWHEVPGGTARASIDLATALLGFDEVELVGVAARHRVLPPDPWRPPIPVRHHRLPRLALYETWHGLRRPAVESVTGPVDVVHVVGGAVVGHRAPLVVTVHDVAFRHHPGMYTRHGLRFLERALQLTRREAAVVAVPSQATLDDCVAAGIEADRLRHVPWGVEVTDPGPDDVARARRSVGLGPDEPYVVVVGTLEPRKNLRRLFAAWRLLDRTDVRLVVVGPSGWGDALGDDAPPTSVLLAGFVDVATRDALYRGAVTSVYPSLFEGFGLPVLESMALGCPVVTSAGTATEELVSGGAGVTVDPEDPASIAAGVAAMLDDGAERDRVAAAALARAETYTWRRAASAMVDVYRGAMA